MLRVVAAERGPSNATLYGAADVYKGHVFAQRTHQRGEHLIYRSQTPQQHIIARLGPYSRARFPRGIDNGQPRDGNEARQSESVRVGSNSSSWSASPLRAVQRSQHFRAHNKVVRFRLRCDSLSRFRSSQPLPLNQTRPWCIPFLPLS